MEYIYLDYAASTPVDKEVLKEMNVCSSKFFGNPNSVHGVGLLANKQLDSARKKIALALSVNAGEVYFTSGGTESNNLALVGFVKSYVRENTSKKPHIILGKFEHASVVGIKNELELLGAQVSYADINESGVIDLDSLKKLIRKETVLVSIMLVNNESGITQSLSKISGILKKYRDTNTSKYPILHSDASQAPRYMSVKPKQLGAELLTLDGQKIYGPKGIGVLYKDTSVKLSPILVGGSQEEKIRPGTQNVCGALAMARAFEICEERRNADNKKLEDLKKYFISELPGAVHNAEINGAAKRAVPGIINIYLPNIIDAERFLIDLDVRGIAISLGSACGTSGREPSHVISAMYGNEERAHKSARFSFGRETTKTHIKKTIEILKEVTREDSPNMA